MGDVSSKVSSVESYMNAKPGQDAEVNFGVENLSNVTDVAASLEAFDNQSNDRIVENTVEFGLKVAQRSPTEEVLYPVRALAMTDTALSLELKNLYVFNSIRRNPNGALANWARKSLITARVNGELLSNDTTKLTPVYRDAADGNNNTRFFVAAAKVSPVDTQYMGSTVKTMPGSSTRHSPSCLYSPASCTSSPSQCPVRCM